MSETNATQLSNTENTTDLNAPTTNISSMIPQSTSVTSFVSKVATKKLPKPEFAIVFNIIKNLSQIEYLIAPGKIITSKDITYASCVI